MLTDSHCHLNFPDFADMTPVLDAMRQAQVDEALCISTLMETLPDVIRLAETHPNLWATVGVHPDNEGVTEPSVDDLCRHAAHPRVLGIGETGLDYFRLGERTVADMQWQRDRFAVHIEAAQRMGLPLIIHTRSASEDTVAMLREAQRAGPVTGVFHCFTETEAVARQALDLGFYVSLSGIVTFKNARDLQDVARWLPQDRLLVETDSPYLAPVPHRGKTNQPAFVAHVAAFVAELRGEPLEEMAAATTRNFRTLFAAKWAAPSGAA